MEKIKNNFSAFLCAIVGLLGIIFSFIPAITYAMDVFGMEFSTSVNQFGAMGMISGDLTLEVRGVEADMEAGFLGILGGLFSILAFLMALALLVWGVLNLLKAFNVASILPETLPIEKLTDKLILFNLAANVLAFVFLLIFCLDNQESEGGASAGLYVAVGVYLNLVLSVLCIVAKKILPKYLPATPAADETTEEAPATPTEE
ncbi:MAG: hypothetical protein IKM34_00625 [Clostridia bacterium]|nr:hypothetical protein [Clostridia bacterium]